MWLCMKEGFLSVVVDKHDERYFWVRARNRQHLVTYFPNERIIDSIDDWQKDYGFRVRVKRETVATLVTTQLMDMDATNFKDSVDDVGLHNLYLRMWVEHARYQDNLYGHKRLPPNFYRPERPKVKNGKPNTRTFPKTPPKFQNVGGKIIETTEEK